MIQSIKPDEVPAKDPTAACPDDLAAYTPTGIMVRSRGQRTLYAVADAQPARAHVELPDATTAAVVSQHAAEPGDPALTAVDDDAPHGRAQAASLAAGQSDADPIPRSPQVRGLPPVTHARTTSTRLAHAERAVRPVRSTDPMLVLAYHHLDQELNAFTRLAPIALAGQDPEGVHRMRTATRRIRAALKAFKKILPAHSVRELGQEFRWLAQALGRVRDLDVYRENLRRYLADLPPESARNLAPYREHLEQEYAEARAQLVTALGSDRYARLLAAFDGFLDAEPSPAALRRRGNFTIADGAAAYVDQAVKRVRRRGRRIDRRSSPESLHDLRIRCKRLRYLLEFLEPAYGGQLRKSIKAVKRLQDTLGEHQDACVASERLRAYAGSTPAADDSAGTLFALGELVQIQKQHAADARKRFRKDWDRFGEQVSRRKLREILDSAG